MAHTPLRPLHHRGYVLVQGSLELLLYPLLAQEQIQAHWYLSGTRVLEWWMQTDEEFRDVLGYKTSLRPRWDAGHPASKATTAVAATIKTTNAR